MRCTCMCLWLFVYSGKFSNRIPTFIMFLGCLINQGVTCIDCCYLCLTDQVALRGEGIEPKSRVFFTESTLRVPNSLLESADVPSVNFRGLMDQVSFNTNSTSPQ